MLNLDSGPKISFAKYFYVTSRQTPMKDSLGQQVFIWSCSKSQVESRQNKEPLHVNTRDIYKMNIHPSEMHHQFSEEKIWFLGQISPKWHVILRISLSYKYIEQNSCLNMNVNAVHCKKEKSQINQKLTSIYKRANQIFEKINSAVFQNVLNISAYRYSWIINISKIVMAVCTLTCQTWAPTWLHVSSNSTRHPLSWCLSGA